MPGSQGSAATLRCTLRFCMAASNLAPSKRTASTSISRHHTTAHYRQTNDRTHTHTHPKASTHPRTEARYRPEARCLRHSTEPAAPLVKVAGPQSNQARCARVQLRHAGLGVCMCVCVFRGEDEFGVSYFQSTKQEQRTSSEQERLHVFVFQSLNTQFTKEGDRY
jgi:hypothetical protein